MRAKEMRDRSDEELRTMAGNLRQELFTARFKNHTSRLYDSSELPKKRRDLARVQTILRERELGIRARREASAEEKSDE
jgi:large subunit ribosomal protein L29